MLLQRLNEYADRLDLPPQLYTETPIRYIIDLDHSGAPVTRQPIDTADPANPRTKRGTRLLAPQIQRAVGIKALLFADNAEYTLGLARPASKPARVAACHQAYRDMVGRCAASTGEPAVAAVAAYLRDNPAERLQLQDDFDRGAMLTFRVAGQFVVELPAVQAFWAAEHDPSNTPGAPAPVMQCLVCGQRRPVLGRLQGKIKGVPGGQTSGVALISANADAFESYGLQASLIAPTCAVCGERFTKALNALLADGQHRIVLGGMAFVYWTRAPVEGFSWGGFLTDPDPAQVRALLTAAQRGQPATELDETAFYAATLSGSGGRAVVRDWVDTTVGAARRGLATWFARQRVVSAYGEEGRPLKLISLAGGTVRELRDLTPDVSRLLLRSALTGGPLPYSLLRQAVRRTQVEQGVTHQHAALIKLVLCSRREGEEESMVGLDADNQDTAYRCGRLLAVLEEVQRLAVPGIKATIVDRFFGTASTAPLMVFARLVKGAQPHLAKLDRDRHGAYVALQARIEEILSGISTFPRTLALEQQALFVLGYYHQRANDRAAAQAARARRAAGQATTEGRTGEEGIAGDEGTPDEAGAQP